MEHLAGIVENIVFQNAEGSFAVFKLKPGEDRSAVTVVAGMPAPLIGEQLELSGEWVEHTKFGQQFKATACKRIAPTSIKGIERFLASGAIKGIGPAMAARLVKHFGLETLAVIEHKSHRLVEIEGIGSKKAQTIHEAYVEQAEIRELMLFLETNGVSGGYAGKIFAQYGSFAIAVLQENPYRLAEEVTGIGFRTADQIAMSLGLERNHPDRLAAGVNFALLQIAQAGHCCVPEEALVEQTAKLLLTDRNEVAARLKALLKEEKLCVEDLHGMTLIYPRHLYYAEKNVAQRLLKLKDKAKLVPDCDFPAAVAGWESAAQLVLGESQREAVISALAHGVLVLTGGPGTGKTTVVKGMLAVLEAQGFQILLAAPTGRAAKRLTEATGKEAVTVHRLLESTGGGESAPRFTRNEDEPLDADVIIIDEASMMDISLMNYFLRAVPDGCRVILVGDIDQLPAVGPGSVLKDIIRSLTIPLVRLTEVFRQAGESMIVQNAHRINRGMLPDYSASADFQFREIGDSAAVSRAIVALCRDGLAEEGFDVRREVQVLSPMHRLDCGVENLNKLLQEALNPASEDKPGLSGPGNSFRLGDKVMQMRNNYEKNVFNGDIGFIVELEPGKLRVGYPDNAVWYEKNDLDELHLAYAMSVHKSQGSEYPVIVMPLIPGHHVMLQRNLLYTAVTRAKERVILLGSKAALHTAVANDRTKRRYSLLAERLRGEGLGC
ncbi:ATP-dependent RecD-like DNA helicase|uniref:ATP-dependent RecD2 DNA helicase n=1 Tax=Dendrosporobacter quercicolus TaxID=146817 RepID=A0A1G9WTT6_9FIRM|nr:ATP-dependent RecD-like DNA helicase [Dendrosporobacter quercicolus]NSL49204.1 ATP-dependent RecD-like DNA helicase [Dendrosporobacter quercicolus DSM 1736]SDM87575.1 exodeoxyribonuclease V alpha subunit [Dendrosporobacter quercicolus]